MLQIFSFRKENEQSKSHTHLSDKLWCLNWIPTKRSKKIVFSRRTNLLYICLSGWSCSVLFIVGFYKEFFISFDISILSSLPFWKLDTHGLDWATRRFQINDQLHISLMWGIRWSCPWPLRLRQPNCHEGLIGLDQLVSCQPRVRSGIMLLLLVLLLISIFLLLQNHM